MKASLSILWPGKDPPAVQEVQFSYQFCRTVSRGQSRAVFPECVWREYGSEEELAHLLAKLPEDLALVVRDPEILLSGTAVARLARAVLKENVPCGPVYNLTASSAQAAAMPSPYVDLETFLEIAEDMAEKETDAPVPVASLDPACVMSPGRRAGAHIPSRLMVDRGALVHVFGDYYRGERDDLVALVPETVQRILDVGCAMGGYGKRLRAVRPHIRLTGIEMNPIMAEAARAFYDEVHTTTLEQAGLSGPFDLVNCGDVMEHLQDPWHMLRHLHQLLVDEGFLVLSVPNAGHWSIARGLLQGKFEYIPVGLLCVTHIRWFTEETLRRALDDAGFTVDVLRREQMPPTSRGEAFIRTVCEKGWGDEMSLRTNEFIVRAQKG